MTENLQNKLAEYEDLLRRLTIKCEELAAENARLRSAEGAHDVLRRLYRDETQSSNVRVLAARAALGVESAPLKPVEAPLDLVGEEVIEPLADVVTRQRARADRMMREGRNIEVLPSGEVRLLKPGGGEDH